MKFSVRKGTGTDSLWISVDWTDGPPTADVEEIARPMEGWRFNAYTDYYETTGRWTAAQQQAADPDSRTVSASDVGFSHDH